jgi:rhamnogalacturonan endolyase
MISMRPHFRNRLARAALVAGLLGQTAARAERQMEALGRGVVAVPQADGTVFVGWRLLGTDPDETTFNVYRTTGQGEPVRLN